MKKVLLIPDVPGWAYDIIAKQICPYFIEYDPSIMYMKDIISGKDNFSFEDYDVVFVFFWYDGFTKLMNVKNYDSSKICLGVHSHNSWIKRNLSVSDVKKVLQQFPVIGCTSKKLVKIFDNHPNVVYTPSGFSPDLFHPRPLPPFDGVLKVGWAGDPDSSHHGDVKGYYSIIKPVIDELDFVELVSQTKQDKTQYEKMEFFYSQCHTYVNTSLNEGSPLPVIEAMACGRSVITTDVGIAPEVINDSNGKIIQRTKGALKHALIEFYQKPETLTEMGMFARKSIKNRTWAWTAMQYEKMFNLVTESYLEG